MAGSRLIINNRVMLRGAANHAAIGKSRLLYIANRDGAVIEKTADDLRIEEENERMAKLGYIEFRPGSVAEQNSGHALFDASGIPERAAPQKELRETESAIITSVVSVRREDAEALNLRRTQARDELAAAMRNGALRDGLRERMLDALPEQGSLKYASLAKRQPEAAKAVADAMQKAQK